MSKSNDPNKVYGQTINIRYYLEKKVKSRPYFWEGQRLDSYPLYVQISVKRQNAQFRSVLGSYFPFERLDDLLNTHSQIIKEETQSLRNRVLAFKPFENANFSLNEALSGYSVLQEDICYIIGSHLYFDYKKSYVEDLVVRMKKDTAIYLPELFAGTIAKDDLDEQEAELRRRARSIFSRGDSLDKLNSRLVFNEVLINAVSVNKHLLAFKKKYGKHFWSLENYCAAMRYQMSSPVLTLGFFLSVNFKENYIKYWGLDSYDSMMNGIEKLRADYAEFDLLLKSCDR
ncbi:hypothetical protein EXU85_22645 [Spirosoma sp. KCTC 42546]|uniref:hypothetical protein n=1 Tax=Spirosoma sp. KCTC 42546 TaxID=2520506 RepID=UPI001159E8B0|nr:hypothetical protein [Spirosoma sp. KCTC 42546]QDK81255.1 hypothetical protein EXU85_22645 [Spirosoma sp. KCTC 42546]